MRVKAAKWGNSIAVRLPSVAVQSLDIKPGRELSVTVRDNELTLRLLGDRRAPSLEDLVAEARRLGPGAQPKLVDWGPDVGAEVLQDD